jgi:4-hydroxybenzoate polyprenyltransferase
MVGRCTPLPERSGGSIEAQRGRFSPAWRAAWGSWLAISLILFAIWLVSGAGGGLWFLWVVLPLGALLLGRWIMGAPAHSERRPARPRRNHTHRGSGQEPR